jgi:predicted DNA-binding protein (MmcQ/YjbR family)
MNVPPRGRNAVSQAPGVDTLRGMDTERARKFLLGLPHVVETQQWGDNLVFWVGSKLIGGKMFCLLNLSGGEHGVVSFAAGAERFAELGERQGLKPAPYMARIYWVAAERWDALRNAEWEQLLVAAHEMTAAKLPKRTLNVLALPGKEREAIIAEKRKAKACGMPAVKAVSGAKKTAVRRKKANPV